MDRRRMAYFEEIERKYRADHKPEHEGYCDPEIDGTCPVCIEAWIDANPVEARSTIQRLRRGIEWLLKGR